MCSFCLESSRFSLWTRERPIIQVVLFNSCLMNQLDLCGKGGLACFYLNMSRGLDPARSGNMTRPNASLGHGANAGTFDTQAVGTLLTDVSIPVVRMVTVPPAAGTREM